jgi:hypothetical protein
VKKEDMGEVTEPEIASVQLVLAGTLHVAIVNSDNQRGSEKMQWHVESA